MLRRLVETGSLSISPDIKTASTCARIVTNFALQVVTEKGCAVYHEGRTAVFLWKCMSLKYHYQLT